jgi:hypothetical protein
LGGVGVMLTGTGLTGATGVTFSGTPATSVTVINSTTVTAVTPPHASGTVDVAITTPAGGAELALGYTYVPIAIGQPSNGGVIACLNGGLQNFFAATADVNSTGNEWGGYGTTTNAQSTDDGATNTTTIVTVLDTNGGTDYAAQLCNNYQVDSRGNTPCQVGNTCYTNWFLPAQNQLGCLYVNRHEIGGFTLNPYWSSTEESGVLSDDNAWGQDFGNSGNLFHTEKWHIARVRCIRSF